MNARTRTIVASGVSAALVVAVSVGVAVAADSGGSHRAVRTGPSQVRPMPAPAEPHCSGPQISAAGVGPKPASRARLEAFRAVGVVRCLWSSRRYPDGEWSVLQLQTSTGSVTSLVRALDRRSQPPSALPANQACAAYAQMQPPVLLVDAEGRYLRPSFPLDYCSHFLPQATRALAQLTWHTVSSTKVHLDVPDDPVLRTCGSGWKDMLRIELGFGRLRPGHGVLASGGSSIVCVYRVGADPTVGDYLRGTRLDPAATRLLARALGGSAPGASCTGQREFAVLHDGADVAYVELGGCWRVLRPDGTLGGAQASTVRSLLRV